MSEDEREVVEVPPSLAQRYQPLRVLGRGGFGVVLLARDDQLDREVALKLMTPGSFQDGTQRRRFLREAQVASAIRSPHVTEVYDVGQADGVPYLAMRFVEGQDLRQRMSEAGGSLLQEEADEVFAGVLSGLAACHREGVVHRDVKPENVLLTGDGVAVLADFGLARGDGARLTATGVVLGTLGYLPPEVAVGAEFSPAGDVYAAAAVYYELRTGELPFGEGAPVPGSPACEGLQHGLRSHGLPAAPELEDLLRRALSPLAAQRPADGGAFLEAFEEARLADVKASRVVSAATSRIAAVVGKPVEDPASSQGSGQRDSSEATRSLTAPARPGPTRGRGVHPVMAAVLLAAGLGFGLGLARRGSPPPSQLPSPAPTANPTPRPAEAWAAARRALEAARGRLREDPAIQAALDLEEAPAEDPQLPRERWEIWTRGNTAFWETVVTRELREACATMSAAPLSPELGTLVHELLRAQHLLTRSENSQVRPAYGLEERSGLRTLGVRFMELTTLERLLVEQVQEGRLSREDFQHRLRLVQDGAELLGGRWKVLRGEEQLYSPEEGIGFMPRLRIVTPQGRKWLTPLELGGEALRALAGEDFQPAWFRRTEELAPTSISLPLEPFEGDLHLLFAMRGWPLAVFGDLRVLGEGGEAVRLVFPSEDEGKIPGQAHPEKYYLRRVVIRAGALPARPVRLELSAVGIQVVAIAEPATNVGLVVQRVGS